MAENEEISQVTYEELASIESEFEEIDNEIMKKQYELSKAAYTKRATAITKIPNFWPLVIEASPPEIDGFVHPQDSKIFAESLTNISVTRHELDTTTPQGHPRSVTITFEFKDNDVFENKVLEKKFWYRRASDGWVGLVSEPVKINWKKGQDLTEGLTEAAVALFEARKKTGDLTNKGLPEYTALKKKLEHSNGQNTSFFSWFGFVSSRRWVSADEAEKAEKEHQARLEARKKGEKVEMPEEEDDEEEEMYGDQAVEVFDNGDDLATTLAEEIWPNAIKYFTQAQEMDDAELSEMDFEDMDEDDEDGDDQPVDIRALVGDKGGKGKRQSDVGPPAKKQKK